MLVRQSKHAFYPHGYWKRVAHLIHMGEWRVSHGEAADVHQATNELGDAGVVERAPEGHDHFGAGAVPTGVQAELEEDDAQALVVLDVGRRDVPQSALADLNRMPFLERMPDLLVG